MCSRLAAGQSILLVLPHLIGELPSYLMLGKEHVSKSVLRLYNTRYIKDYITITITCINQLNTEFAAVS